MSNIFTIKHVLLCSKHPGYTYLHKNSRKTFTVEENDSLHDKHRCDNKLCCIPVNSRAFNAQSNSQVNARPRWMIGTAVAAEVVARHLKNCRLDSTETPPKCSHHNTNIRDIKINLTSKRKEKVLKTQKLNTAFDILADGRSKVE